MDFVLRETAAPDDVRDWLRCLVRDFGLGFHLDTPADEYVADDGLRLLPPRAGEELDRSIDRVFAVLGDEEPYEVCSEEMYRMLVGKSRPA